MKQPSPSDQDEGPDEVVEIEATLTGPIIPGQDDDESSFSPFQQSSFMRKRFGSAIAVTERMAMHSGNALRHDEHSYHTVMALEAKRREEQAMAARVVASHTRALHSRASIELRVRNACQDVVTWDQPQQHQPRQQANEPSQCASTDRGPSQTGSGKLGPGLQPLPASAASPSSQRRWRKGAGKAGRFGSWMHKTRTFMSGILDTMFPHADPAEPAESLEVQDEAPCLHPEPLVRTLSQNLLAARLCKGQQASRSHAAQSCSPQNGTPSSYARLPTLTKGSKSAKPGLQHQQGIWPGRAQHSPTPEPLLQSQQAAATALLASLAPSSVPGRKGSKALQFNGRSFTAPDLDVTVPESHAGEADIYATSPISPHPDCHPPRSGQQPGSSLALLQHMAAEASAQAPPTRTVRVSLPGIMAGPQGSGPYPQPRRQRANSTTPDVLGERSAWRGAMRASQCGGAPGVHQGGATPSLSPQPHMAPQRSVRFPELARPALPEVSQ